MGLSTFNVRSEGDKIILIADKQYGAVMPIQAAQDLIRALTVATKKAVEFANADRIADDQAILDAAGIPINITGNKKIQKEAKKRAERINIPGARPIESKEVVTKPTIIQHAPKENSG